MPLAGQVAIELRKLADALDKEPLAEVERPMVYFADECSSKERFLNLARLMPRPFAKKEHDDCGQPALMIESKNDVVWIWAKIPRSSLCRVLRPAIPAEYECEPLLSQEEEDSLGAVQS